MLSLTEVLGVWLQGGWNRWTHTQRFGPLAMEPPQGEGRHFRAALRVPRNAHSLDFVFADVAQGEGTYDNRGGLDYSLPVEGSQVCGRPPHVFAKCCVCSWTLCKGGLDYSLPVEGSQVHASASIHLLATCCMCGLKVNKSRHQLLVHPSFHAKMPTHALSFARHSRFPSARQLTTPVSLKPFLQQCGHQSA
jgi:hypothetical protein